MFGFSKRKRIKSLEELVDKLKRETLSFYSRKQDAEGRASLELYNLAESKGITAKAAASTPEGIDILAEVVLNRQYAFYLNEQTIQAYYQLCRLENKDINVISGDDWLNKIVKNSGWLPVYSEIEVICGQLIKDVDLQLKEFKQ